MTHIPLDSAGRCKSTYPPIITRSLASDANCGSMSIASDISQCPSGVDGYLPGILVGHLHHLVCCRRPVLRPACREALLGSRPSSDCCPRVPTFYSPALMTPPRAARRVSCPMPKTVAHADQRPRCARVDWMMPKFAACRVATA